MESIKFTHRKQINNYFIFHSFNIICHTCIMLHYLKYNMGLRMQNVCNYIITKHILKH